jgi:hypothetical protein
LGRRCVPEYRIGIASFSTSTNRDYTYSPPYPPFFADAINDSDQIIAA